MTKPHVFADTMLIKHCERASESLVCCSESTKMRHVCWKLQSFCSRVVCIKTYIDILVTHIYLALVFQSAAQT